MKPPLWRNKRGFKGPGIGKFYAELKKKYDADITEEEETARIRRWEHDRMFAKKELIGGTKNE